MRTSFWVSITLGLTAYLALPLPGLSAPLSERIASTRQKLEHTKHREGVLTETISGYSSRISGLQGEIRGLKERQGRIQVSLEEKRAELAQVRDRLERARDRLVRLRADLRVAEGALATRLVELYKADRPDALTVILEADGFADLLERTEFLERISEQDQRIVGRVRVLKAQTTRQANQLAGLETRVEQTTNAILAKRNELAASKGRLVRVRDNLAGARDGKKAVLAKVREESEHLHGNLRALQAAAAQATSALQGVQGQAFSSPGAGPIKRGSGRLIWPVNGPVTSGFGMRWGRLHAGVDISAPAGTPIRAADSGRVVLLGGMGGYGNYTCIQHTGSLSTCYAHQSRYGTSRGASVSQGQVIGYVGCTGSCTGNHLHFEVRVNGSPVNPLGYL